MEEYRWKPRRYHVRREVREIWYRNCRKDRAKGTTSSLRNRVRSEKLLEMCGGLSRGRVQKTFLHGPTDFAKTMKLRFDVGDLDPPERINKYISIRKRRKYMHRCALGVEQ